MEGLLEGRRGVGVRECGWGERLGRGHRGREEGGVREEEVFIYQSLYLDVFMSLYLEMITYDYFFRCAKAALQ